MMRAEATAATARSRTHRRTPEDFFSTGAGRSAGIRGNHSAEPGSISDSLAGAAGDEPVGACIGLPADGNPIAGGRLELESEVDGSSGPVSISLSRLLGTATACTRKAP